MTLLRDIEAQPYHTLQEQLVDIICNKTQNLDRNFYRIEVAYFFGKMAACMRAKIKTKDRGDIPTNIYALALATSGYGKGHSVNIIEERLLKGFRKKFLDDTFPTVGENTLHIHSNSIAASAGTDPAQEKEKLDTAFRNAGAYPFTFDSGTAPAVKQLRDKLLMAGIGSINLQIDEIGSNLIGNEEILNVFLELYDKGIVKQKLVKNTAENIRVKDFGGSTPANALLFGTPSKLLDGGATENKFYDFLETGYARRCLFAYGNKQPAGEDLTPKEVYERMINQKDGVAVMKVNNQLAQLADATNYEYEIDMPDDEAIELLTYKIQCESIAESLPEHKEIHKAELSHRYFKVLKLAGIYAFIDQSPTITMDHIYYAIKLVEQSGKDFEKIVNREKAYVKLAKFIADNDTEVTHADLTEQLPFYSNSSTRRNELMNLAMAWGYKQHIVIKKRFFDGIEFFSGSALETTDLNKLTLSASNHMAYNYQPEVCTFKQLGLFASRNDLHWCNHRFKGDHRTEENVIAGFNMVVLDIDGTASLDIVHELMSEYRFMTYTTKRHTTDQHRFRLVMPMKYVLNLDKQDYLEFMNNLIEWLPFDIDEGANQRARKWMSNDGDVHFNTEGVNFDPTPFIPKTSKNEQHRKGMEELKSLNNMERWFAQRIATGNRNNNLIRFALALLDSGMGLEEVERAVYNFNAKLNNSLPVSEIANTILKTVAARVAKK